MINNILTIDLESWFHFDQEYFKKKFGKLDKTLDDGFLVASTEILLDLLDKYEQKATFFVLAEVYTWYPSLIRKIKQKKHEIAFHGFNHQKLIDQKTLNTQLERSADFLKEFKPKGFRAPDIYLKREYFNILKKYNFLYDSSSYGLFKKKPHKIDGIYELPVSIFKIKKNHKKNNSFPKNLKVSLFLGEIPFGSGFFLSLLKDKASFFIDKTNKNELPVVIFLHPWQTYNNPLNSLKFKFLYFFKSPAAIFYLNNTYSTLETLFKKYKFTSIENCLKKI